MIPGVLLTIFAQIQLKRKFAKYSLKMNEAKMTGKTTARTILDSEGLQNVPVNSIKGSLTDHYDPRNKSINLSKPIYSPFTVASMGVAAHEVGHAIQDKDGYFFMRLRSMIVPVATIGTNFGYILIMTGLIIGKQDWARIGVLLFLLTTLFALVTLPVEFDATKRGKAKLKELGLTKNPAEDKWVDDMLGAAALTYIASFATSAIQGLYWALTVRNRFSDDSSSTSTTSRVLEQTAKSATKQSSSKSQSKSKSSTPTTTSVLTKAAKSSAQQSASKSETTKASRRRS